eukprot:CAMPEP_0176384156 /NCGR_PEP_ID=MMETSP0126-20121128/34092_1 /TAXON_ID=141414 ORGANISM="Strombidinopsis acuminatum, Strain SPMC142" /NCGR_SAMPLE_ID=MMETSP0126 /ASSEMBLY_ACC=CAM_ASM_000229 /LENGTH=135 /DNA_ID=CAMNT_0017749683 /DNA_START=16 /DNA_END=423 /DNA_ORIENTATION=+
MPGILGAEIKGPDSDELVPEFMIAAENLIDPDNGEIDNYFICVICTNVVDEPKECDSCERWYCSKCIDKWTQKNNSCPNCKVDWKEAKRVSRFAYKKLEGLIFACDSCEKHFKYAELKNHWTTQCMNKACDACGA